MKNSTLYALWGSLLIICAAFGFIPEPRGFVRGLLTALALLSFLPPALLLYRARTKRDLGTLKLLRRIAAASLLLTLLTMILNILFAASTEAVGNFFHGLLVIVSTPMICSGYWALSLFLWACLLFAAAPKK